MAASDADALATNANAVAARWENEALQFIQDLRGLANTIFNPNLADTRLPITFTTRDNEMRTAIDGEPVKSPALRYAGVSDPGGAPAVSISNAVSVTVPTLEAAAPTLDLPERPAQLDATKPTAPSIASVDLPDSPTLSLPTPPTVATVAFPDVPSLALPTFEVAFPATPSFLIATKNFDFSEEFVDTPLIDAASNKLLGDIENGGYGIEPDDEEALWARARDRELGQLNSAVDEALDDFATRGFSMPTGAANATIERVRKEAEDRLAEANREITVARAALLRDNRQFSMTTGIGLDTVLLQQAGFRMERALNASRAVVELSIAVHDAEVRAYNAEVQAYATYLQQYRAALDTQLARVQIYSEQVQAAVAQQQAQQTEVDLYRALVDASQATISLFETEVRAVATALDAERLKVETYRTQVQAYATEIQANATQFDAYEAGVRGELAKAQVYNTQVDAFRSQVQAASVESDVRNRQVQVEIERARTQLQAYASDVQAFQARIGQEAERARSYLSEYQADTDVYRAALNAWQGLVQVTISEIDSITRQQTSEVQLEQSNARLQLEAAVEGARRRFESAASGTQLTSAFSQLAGESLGLLAAQIQNV